MDFQVGVNLGGWLSQYSSFNEQHFDTFITAEDIERIAGWGMDHVRLAVDYPVLEDEAHPFHYRESGFAHVDQCLEWCHSHGLGVILDLHKAPGYSFDALDRNALFANAELQERFVSLWRQIARRYAGLGDRLAFELLNEIVLPDSAPWNTLARRGLAAVREENVARTVVIGGNHYNVAAELANLELFDDPAVIYTFHCYDPAVFTHQKAYWVPALKAFAQAVEYPGVGPDVSAFLHLSPNHVQDLAPYANQPLNIDLLRRSVQPAVDFQRRTGRRVYCGEFGAIALASMPGRIRWHRDFLRVLQENGIGGAVWSYKEMDFGLVNAAGQVVNEELVRVVARRDL